MADKVSKFIFPVKSGDKIELKEFEIRDAKDAAGHLQAEIDATNGNIGTLASLTTDDKTSAVAAINEVDAHADTAKSTADAAQQMIAPIQSSLTASKAYAVGEQFVYNGLLYKATVAIAQGGTITIGGNCALADSVTEQIANCVANANNRMPTYNITVQSGTIREIFSDLTAQLEALNIGVTTGVAHGVITGRCFFTYQFFRYASYEFLGILTLGHADNKSYIANRAPSIIVIKEISATEV